MTDINRENGCIVLSDRTQTLDRIYSNIEDVIKKRGVCTVSEVCEMIGSPYSSKDEESGWRSIKGMFVEKPRDNTDVGELVLPEPLIILSDNKDFRLTFVSLNSAQELLTKISDSIKKYNRITVAEVLDSVDMISSDRDNKYGWTELDGLNLTFEYGRIMDKNNVTGDIDKWVIILPLPHKLQIEDDKPPVEDIKRSLIVNFVDLQGVNPLLIVNYINLDDECINLNVISGDEVLNIYSKLIGGGVEYNSFTVSYVDRMNDSPFLVVMTKDCGGRIKLIKTLSKEKAINMYYELLKGGN